MRISKQSKNERGATARLHIVVPEEDKQQWIETAELLGMSVSEYVRKSVRNSRVQFVIRQKINLKGIDEIAYQFARIGGNINQIAYHLNAGFSWSDSLIETLQNCLDDMEDTMQILRKTAEEFNGIHQTQFQQECKLWKD